MNMNKLFICAKTSAHIYLSNIIDYVPCSIELNWFECRITVERNWNHWKCPKLPLWTAIIPFSLLISPFVFETAWFPFRSFLVIVVVIVSTSTRHRLSCNDQAPYGCHENMFTVMMYVWWHIFTDFTSNMTYSAHCYYMSAFSILSSFVC